MRRIFVIFLVITIHFLIGGVNVSLSEDAETSSYDIEGWRSFQGLPSNFKLTKEYMLGTWSDLPSPLGGDDNTGVSFRENGQCKIFWPSPSVDVMRGAWRIVENKLEITLTSQSNYERNIEEELDSPLTVLYEINDLKSMYNNTTPTQIKPMFDGIATELKREYFIGSWLDVPYIAEGGSSVDLKFYKNGEYEILFSGVERLTTEEHITMMWGTWKVENNKLVIVITRQKKYWGGTIKIDDELGKMVLDQESSVEELAQPIIQTYEIADLQYVHEIPKDYDDMDTFVEWYMESYLGEMLTMHMGERQFWRFLD